ncbi:S24 family peptidase [Geminisphaera colitermitum]|uniref:S24 family peptidase n=1 Tax=Geminisphaera colitermitum TaxID=1148786 RepID=UPI0005BC712F|nr:S24 family peptidase [Geminisphaera colitermitum]
MMVIKSDKRLRVDGRLRYTTCLQAAGLVVGLAVGLGGCASEPSGPAAGVASVAGEWSGAPSVDVSRWQAWRDAEKVAAAGPDRFAVIGSGDSMQPVYGDRTVLVLQRVDYATLQPGMQVAYRNRAGRMVVHRLLKAVQGGWQAMGLNNTVPDAELVTEVNLIGIVYASFANDSVK